MRHYRIPTNRGEVAAHVLAPDVFDGEYNPRSVFYSAGAWAVSALAFVTNSMQAVLQKRKHKSFGGALWNIGRDRQHISSVFVDRFSRFNHQAKWGAAGWRSLELFYNYREKVEPLLGNNIEGWVTRHWIGKFENRQAVTNRLKIAINLITDAIDAWAGETEIRLMSIASGSAQAVVEALKRRPQANVRVLLIDFDESAMDEARKLVAAAGLEARFSYRIDTTKAIESSGREFAPHIVEMIGFLDYRPRDKAISLIDRIRRQLPDKGLFLTCNIHHNREKIFLDWVLLWPMIYRTDAEFAELMVEGGFAADQVRLIYEPFRIHGIAVCRK